MTDPDANLSALWAQDEPPARDPAFVVAVMERAARRRLWWGVAALIPPTVAASAVLWSLAPALAGLSDVLVPSMLAPAAAAVSLAWLIGWGPLRSPQ